MKLPNSPTRTRENRIPKFFIGCCSCFFLSLSGQIFEIPNSFASASSLLSQARGMQILEDIQNAFSALAEDVTPTVVNVSPIRILGQSKNVPRQRRPKTHGSGSGVIIHEDGYIITNNHVIGGGVEVEIRLSDRTTLIAEVVGRDPDTDLALLKVQVDRKLPAAKFGDSSVVKVGQWVLAVGNPFGLDRTVTLGVVSGIGRENMNLSKYENFIQTDASINPGNSGGPLFNLRGEVIGINTAIINFAQGIGFAIPSNMVNRIIMQLKTGGKVVRGWLGVGIQPLTPNLGEKFGVEDGKGILVNEVFEGDPADMAGIKPGDIITSIGGERLESPNQLSRVVAGFGPGEEVEVQIIRDGQSLTFPVFLGIKKEKPMVTSLPPMQNGIDLGIDVSPITDELADRYKIDDREGILVTTVGRKSIAYSEGVREGDVIKEVNRVEVPTLSKFRDALEDIRPGETILLRILRESRAFFVVLKPES
jgi:serine protease Do